MSKKYVRLIDDNYNIDDQPSKISKLKRKKVEQTENDDEDSGGKDNDYDSDQQQEQQMEYPIPTGASGTQYSVITFFGTIFGLFLLPITLIILTVKFIISLVKAFVELVMWIISEFWWIFILIILYAVGIFWISYMPVTIAYTEHVWRCDVVSYWEFPLRPLVEMAKNIVNWCRPWTNAFGLINRLLGVTLFIEILGKDFFDWIYLTAIIVGSFIEDALSWTFLADSLNNAFPAYRSLTMVSDEWVPKTTYLMLKLCKDLKPLFSWSERILSSKSATCAIHQFVNYSMSAMQVYIKFIYDFLKLIFLTVITGGNYVTISQILKGELPGDVAIPSLSKDSTKEKLPAAGLYLGKFLNEVVSITICSFKSEMDANGDSDSADGLYMTCINDPSNHYRLFNVLGPVAHAFTRWTSIWTVLIANLPRILWETGTRPAGDRFLTEVWYKVHWNYFFDSIRNPILKYDYSGSINFPTPIPGSDISTILYNDVTYKSDLYGPYSLRGDSNHTCYNLNNSRTEVPCLECGEVPENDAITEGCKACDDLEAITYPLTNMTLWNPWICFALGSYVRTNVAIGKLAVGLGVHVFNLDRMGAFLADQNHYDQIADELGGKPYQTGGLLGCVYLAAIGLDDRLGSLALVVVKPMKAHLEAVRLGVITVVRFINDIVGTGEPGFASYICLDNYMNCVDLERSLSHLRRPRAFGMFVYDNTFKYVPPLDVYPKAFIDCACEIIDFNILTQFMNEIPGHVPDFCCLLHYYFRWLVENEKLMIQLWIGVIQSVVSIFDPNVNFNLVLVDWLACARAETCVGIAAVVSDLEDLLNCPCDIILALNFYLAQATDGFQFFCICDFITGLVQWWTLTERADLLLTSCIIDVIYCIGNGWPQPHCTVDLPSRFSFMWKDLRGAVDALAAAFGSIGCILGLPWLGTGQDCLGTRWTWPLDYPQCHNSRHGMGVCTMSDRLSMVTRYLFELVMVSVKFMYDRMELLLNFGFNILDATLFGASPSEENSIAKSITALFLTVRDPLFGHTNLVPGNPTAVYNISTPIQDLNYTYFYETITGDNKINVTAMVMKVLNISNPYRPPPSYTVYNNTFYFQVDERINVTTGLIQALGLTLNCLLGPPGTSPDSTCPGPQLYAASEITGLTGCLGDVMIAAANGLRDVYTAIVQFIGDGLYIIETIFLPAKNDQIGEAIKNFVIDFFVILKELLRNMDLIAQAIEHVILQVINFVFGRGLMKLVEFFLDKVVKVFQIFISIINAFLTLFGAKRNILDDDSYLDDILDHCTYQEIMSGTCFQIPESYSSLYEAFTKGSFSYYTYSMEEEQEKEEEKVNDEDTNIEDDEYWWLGSKTIGESIRGVEKRLTSLYSPVNNTKTKEKNANMKAKVKRNLVWKRQTIGDFTLADAQAMTDGTYCKKVMLSLDGKSRFDNFELAEEALWKGCFILWELPNLIYAVTNGLLYLPPDFFYNTDVLLPSLLSTAQTISAYVDRTSQNSIFGASANDYSLYTQIVDVPPAVLEIAQQQIQAQQIVAVTMVRSRIEPMSDDEFRKHLDDTVELMTKYNKRKRDDVPNGGYVYNVEVDEYDDFLNARLTEDDAYLNYDGRKRSILHQDDVISKAINLPKIDNLDGVGENPFGMFEFDQCYVEYIGAPSGHCLDTKKLMKGFTIQLMAREEEDESGSHSQKIDLKKIQRKYRAKTKKSKRQLSTVTSGSGMNTLLYEPNAIDNPYVNSIIEVYTALNGDIVLNISSINRLVPVLNGKIAITRTNYTFNQYLQDNALDTPENMFYIADYENFATQAVQEGYLGLHSALTFFNRLWTNSSVPTTSTGSNTSTTASAAKKRKTVMYDQNQTWSAPMSERNRYSHVKLPDFLNHFIDSFFGHESRILDKEREPTTFTDHPIGKSLSVAAGVIKNSFYAARTLTHSYRNPNVENTIKVPLSSNHQSLPRHRRRRFDDDVEEKDVRKTKRFQDSVSAYNEKHYKGVEKIKEMGVYKHHLEVVIPQTMHHLFKSFTAYFNFNAITNGVERLKNGDDGVSKKRSDVFKNNDGHLNNEITEIDLFKWNNPKVSYFWVLDEESGEINSKPGSLLWDFDEEDNKARDVTGYKYDENSVVYMIYDEFGYYRTYKTLNVALVNASGTEESHNFYAKDSFANHEDKVYVDPIHFYENGGELSKESIKITLNYYEYHYMTYESSLPCLNETYWIEKYIIDKTNQAFPFRRVEVDDILPEGTVSFHIMYCYRRSTMTPNHPHQLQYGHILKGKSLYEHRLEMVKRYYYDGIWGGIKARLQPKQLLKETKRIYVEPWAKKVKETYEIHGRIPTLTRSYLVLDSLRAWYYGDDTYKVPDVILAELGHPVYFDDDYVDGGMSIEAKKRSHESKYEAWKEMEWSKLYEKWKLVDLASEMGIEIEAREKRQFNYTSYAILNICLPRNISDASNIVTNCQYCAECKKKGCGFCGSCGNCTTYLNGTSECGWCSNCRVEGPYCDGGCQGCTGCSTGVLCTDCMLTQKIIPPIIFWINQAYNPTPLQPLPGTSLFCYTPYNHTFSDFPNWSDYTYYRLPGFIWDCFLHIVNYLAGFDLYVDSKNFFLNFNLNPFVGCVGFKFVVLRRLGLPLFYKCNYDIDLSGTFGMGLRKAIVVAFIITVVFLLFGWLLFSPMGMIMVIIAGSGGIMFFFVLTVQLAWFWNPSCMVPPASSLLNVMGIFTLPNPLLPPKAADEVYSLLNDILVGYWYWFPPSLTTDGIIKPSTCEPDLSSSYLHVPNCSEYGFTSGYSIVAYTLQKYVPNPVNYWVVSYVNDTCLVKGGCLYQKTTYPNDGVLAPFYAYNFTQEINNGTLNDTLTTCFISNLPAIGELIIPFFFALLAVYLSITFIVIVLEFLWTLITLSPLSWIFSLWVGLDEIVTSNHQDNPMSLASPDWYYTPPNPEEDEDEEENDDDGEEEEEEEEEEVGENVDENGNVNK